MIARLGRTIYFLTTGSRKFWLLPLVLSLLLVIVLIALGGASVVAPFLYPGF
ncbi:MAG: DUF5989 family protein [Chloroflexia bacterium]